MTHESLYDKLNRIDSADELMELWKQWHTEQGKNYFITDGIVDPAVYESQTSPKICFLLEECYFTPETDYETDLAGEKHHWNKYIHKDGLFYSYDLRKNLEVEPAWCMWKRVAYMAATIYNALGFNIDISDVLRHVAIVNLKKSEGASSSDLHNDIANYIENDKPLLHKQIEMTSPDIIICGRTFDICRSKGLLDKNQMQPVCSFASKSGLRKAVSYGNSIFVDTWHPSASFAYKRFEDAFSAQASVIKSALNGKS